MNAEGYVSPPTFRLRCICITEIVLGVLAVIGSGYNLLKQKPPNHSEWSIFHVICAVLLLGTGIHGTQAIRRVRMRILDCRAFRILGACNVVLCIIYSLSLLVLLFALIVLASMPSIAQSLLGFMASVKDDDDDDNETAQEMRRVYEEITWRNNMIIVGLVVGMVLAAVLVGLTATAATISFRFSSGVSAASRQVVIPPAGVPLIAGPGYGAYPMAPMHMDSPPAYSPYPPFKQDLH